MLLRTPKNSRLALWCALLLATLVTFVTPEAAFAYNFGSYGPPISGGQVCPNGSGLTAVIVPCVKETILTALNIFLVPWSAFMATTVSAACVLAIAIGGIWVASGRVNAALRDMSILFIKIIFVILMTHNFGGLFGTVLDIMEDLLRLAGQYAISMSSLSNQPNCAPLYISNQLSQLVWERVDCAIETLVGGIVSPFTLSMGIAGFLMSALISTTAGAFIALIGIYIVIQLVYALAKAVYTFISAYIAIAIMVLISPIFIPCILFQVTKSYFDKWLRLTVSFILQPMIVFAYLSMLMVAVDASIFIGPNSVYRALAGDAVDQPGFELGAYLLGVGAYGEEPMMAEMIGIDSRKILNQLGAPAGIESGIAGKVGTLATDSVQDWSNNIYEWMGLGHNGNDLRYFKVDWPTTAVDWDWLAFLDGSLQWNSNGDPDPTLYMIKLFTSFFMAAIVAYIFLNMLDALPFLSAGLAGVPAGMPTLGQGRLAPPGGSLMETFKSKLNALGGNA